MGASCAVLPFPYVAVGTPCVMGAEGRVEDGQPGLSHRCTACGAPPSGGKVPAVTPST